MSLYSSQTAHPEVQHRDHQDHRATTLHLHLLRAIYWVRSLRLGDAYGRALLVPFPSDEGSRDASPALPSE